jgi:glutamate formiminotransferase/formiminotetrahydrofolate cyclodeaminase
VEPVERPSFRSLSLADFVDRLASAEPVPGGGSASAVAASLGAGLVAMVAALCEGRPKYAAHAATHAAAFRIGRDLAARFLVLADEDAAAYTAFAAALKLPRESDADQAARGSALRAAARLATEVPLRTVEACLELVGVTEALAGRSNTNASSDLNVAALLGEAGAAGAAENVRVNLAAVGDEGFARNCEARVTVLLADVARLAESTHAVVADGAARPPLPDDALARLGSLAVLQPARPG